MGSIVAVLVFLFLIVAVAVIALALVVGVAGILFAGGIGLVHRGAASRPPAPPVQRSEGRGASARPASPRRRVLLVAGGIVALVLSLTCLSPLVFLGVKYGPGIITNLRVAAAEAREKPTLDAAIEDARQFVSAERMYRAKSGGFFGTPECLARPQACIPGYTGPAFIDPAAAALGTRGGFVWTFQPVARADTAASPSPSHLSGYALLGVRAEPSDGSRSVCGDADAPDQGLKVCTFVGRTVDVPGVCPASCIWHSWLNESFDAPNPVGAENKR
jgi:hypothetical protein